MKNLVVLLAMACFLFLAVGAVEAKPLKSFVVIDYSVDVPDDTVLPEYFPRLELMSAEMKKMSTPDGEVSILVQNYRDPEYAYTQGGQEVPAYTEVIKYEKYLHVVGVFFLSEDGVRMEFLSDRKSLESPATDKLERLPPLAASVQKVPRVRAKR